MKVGIITDATVGTMDYLLYPEQRQSTLDYFREQAEGALEYLTERGRQFVEKTRDTYKRYTDGSTVRAARQAVRYSENIVRPNVILPLKKLDDIRIASPAMRRYIMANPIVQTEFRKQRIDGYSDDYVDFYPKWRGEKHYDYRRATTGLVEFFTDEDGQENFKATTYLDELLEGDRELDLMEKIDIQTTWEHAEAFIASGQDPTDAHQTRSSSDDDLN